MRERFRRKYNLPVTDPRFKEATDYDVLLDAALDEAREDAMLRDVRERTEEWGKVAESLDRFTEWQEKNRLSFDGLNPKKKFRRKVRVMGRG